MIDIAKKFSYFMRYDDFKYFFLFDGSAGMILTPNAAMSVCDHAIDHGYVVIIVEGGIWHDPGFEARLDCIWMAKKDPPMSRANAIESNALARQDIEMESAKHSAFIVTVAPYDRPLLSGS